MFTSASVATSVPFYCEVSAKHKSQRGLIGPHKTCLLDTFFNGAEFHCVHIKTPILREWSLPPFLQEKWMLLCVLCVVTTNSPTSPWWVKRKGSLWWEWPQRGGTVSQGVRHRKAASTRPGDLVPVPAQIHWKFLLISILITTELQNGVWRKRNSVGNLIDQD